MNAAIPERRPAAEEVSGVIERVTFHDDDSGFCVLRVKARGLRRGIERYLGSGLVKGIGSILK